MFFASELTWNIRDKHMAETAGLVAEHLQSRSATPKVVICESLFLPLIGCPVVPLVSPSSADE